MFMRRSGSKTSFAPAPCAWNCRPDSMKALSKCSFGAVLRYLFCVVTSRNTDRYLSIYAILMNFFKNFL